MRLNKVVSTAIAVALAVSGLAVSFPVRAWAADTISRAQFDLIRGDKTKAEVEAVMGALGEPAWVQSQFKDCHGGDEGPFYGYRFASSAEEFGGAEIIIEFRDDQSGDNIGDGWNSYTFVFYPFCVGHGYDSTGPTGTSVEVLDSVWSGTWRDTVAVPNEVFDGQHWYQVDSVAGSVKELAGLDVTRAIGITGIDISCLDTRRYETYCSLTELLLGNQPRLQSIYLPMSRLTGLDTGGATHLTNLVLRNNKLTTLNISGSTELISLEAEGNKLANLDVSRNLKLVSLSANDNRLRALSVSKNVELEYLDASGNASLKKMNLSANRKLKELWVFSCGKWPSKLSYSKLTKLDELRVGPKKLSKKQLPTRLRHVKPVKKPHSSWTYSR